MNNSAQSGIGFTGLLTLLFIGLKLSGNIGWSWLWVLSPAWLPMAAAYGFIMLLLLLSVIVEVFK